MKAIWLLPVLLIGCHSPMGEPDPIIEPDPMEEPDPIIAIREKLEGTYQGTLIRDRLYKDTAMHMFLHDIDTTFVQFIPQIDKCSLPYVVDSTAFTISNIAEIYGAPTSFCYTAASLADSVLGAGFHVSQYIWGFKWHVYEGTISSNQRKEVTWVTGPDFTIRTIWTYELSR